MELYQQFLPLQAFDRYWRHKLVSMNKEGKELDLAFKQLMTYAPELDLPTDKDIQPKLRYRHFSKTRGM